MQDNKVGADFVVSNDIGGLVDPGTIPIVCSSVLDAEILGLWKALVWVVEKIPGNRIELEGDTLSILAQFTRSMTRPCHPLLQNACLLRSKFMFDIRGKKVTYMQNL